ncbi:MAG: polysaccharide biosynthesis/export family protein [Deltaproteobacteria bacterium]|nr:polysaccharide biosynthesis/export family protein [Deltaproteobacteria bacterium]
MVSTTADPDPDPRRDNPAPQAAVIGENPAADYVIGPGDVIDIAVWRDEALTRSVIVSPDGRFSFPLIGEVAAQGKTVSELKAELEKSIGRFVPDPVLSLELKQANSMQIYVIGKVNNPGRFVIQSHVNVLQALAMAGGLNPFARESRIRILRQDTIGGTASFPFDYDRVTRGKDLEQNIRLKRGDVVIVP